MFQAATLAIDVTNADRPPRSRWTDKQKRVCIFAHMVHNIYNMDNTYVRQHTYLPYDTCMGEKFCVCEYVCCLKQMNNYLPMLPVKDCTHAVKLTDAQLHAIMERACPKRWDEHLLVHNFDIHNKCCGNVKLFPLNGQQSFW